MADTGPKPLGPTSSLSPSPLFPLFRAVKGVEGAGKGGREHQVARPPPALDLRPARVCRIERVAQASESPRRNPGRIPGR